MTTFVLSMFNADLVSRSGEPVVLGLALAYGGIAQLLAGMWEFRTGNTFGAVAFTSFGAFWLSFWAFVPVLRRRASRRPTPATPSGLYLIAWGIFTAYMFIASLRTTGAIALVFILLAVTFFLLGIGNARGQRHADQGRRLRSASRRRSWPGTRRLRRSRTPRSAARVVPVCPLKR